MPLRILWWSHKISCSCNICEIMSETVRLMNATPWMYLIRRTSCFSYSGTNTHYCAFSTEIFMVLRICIVSHSYNLLSSCIFNLNSFCFTGVTKGNFACLVVCYNWICMCVSFSVSYLELFEGSRKTKDIPFWILISNWMCRCVFFLVFSLRLIWRFVKYKRLFVLDTYFQLNV